MKQLDKLGAVISGLIFLVVVIWFFGPGESGETALVVESAASSFKMDAYELVELAGTVEWNPPAPQGGPNWIFDIFTPPVIYYNEFTGAFSVIPPFPEAGSIDEAFELELVEIHSVPYRFQLVSYAGDQGNYVLTLEDLESGKDLFCAPDEILADHGLKILGFVETRVVASSSRSGATEAFDLVGEARVEDQISGKLYSLRLNQITFMDEPIARFQTHSGLVLQLEKGARWDSESGTYSVEFLHLEDQSAVVHKSSSKREDQIVKVLYASKSTHSSDLSNRPSRESDSLSEAF